MSLNDREESNRRGGRERGGGGGQKRAGKTTIRIVKYVYLLTA